MSRRSPAEDKRSRVQHERLIQTISESSTAVQQSGKSEGSTTAPTESPLPNPRDRSFSARNAECIADFAIEFRTLAVESGWNEEALVAFLNQGLSELLKDELAFWDLPSNLD
ncbi:hypothetical protein SKAU_G00282850 [Synaphobranchus kaupii]|uniref:Uncharacterized protein n=1 Tax=Synaphobranchus kaupii TaxID=118154 RepID=A0A9Q1IN65_SYNKA|nr:hypothetical protein SKAU_G00282850 [Synaphobranchus kaupii]